MRSFGGFWRVLLWSPARAPWLALPCPACPALPCPALACPALPCPGLAWPGLAWPGLAWPGLAWPGLAWPALPCPALPCPALPCPALPCPALPCPALLLVDLLISIYLNCSIVKVRHSSPYPSSSPPLRLDIQALTLQTLAHGSACQIAQHTASIYPLLEGLGFRV